MVGTMTGTKILKRVGVSLFQGTKKLKMDLLNESSRDYRKDVSNNRINLTRNSRVRFWQQAIACAGYAGR
jgi:hypothetical protein